MTRRENPILAAARNLGRDAGEAAGSWAADGNTDPAHARRVLALIEDCDPRADAYLPTYPALSGEYADDPVPGMLADELGIDPEHEIMEAVCDAWEAGVSETYLPACERELRAAAGAEEVTGPASRYVTATVAARTVGELSAALAELAGDDPDLPVLMDDENIVVSLVRDCGVVAIEIEADTEENLLSRELQDALRREAEGEADHHKNNRGGLT